METLLKMDKQDRNTEKKEVTCSVLFTNSKFNPEEPSSVNELDAVTCLVSRTEDLQLDRVFKGASQGQVPKAPARSLLEFKFSTEIDWAEIEQDPQEQLETVLRQTIENHDKTTVQIEINQMYFNCHLIVLQVYSRFFKYLKEAPLLVTLPEDQVTQNAFMLIYKWMLTDEPALDQRYLAEIYVATTYLRIDALLANCWIYFDDDCRYNEDTACLLYVRARCHPALDVVRNLMLTRIQKFLLIFVATRDFLNLPASHLIYLLDSSDISVNTEIEILFIAVRWLGHHWERRRKHAKRIVSCVRFHLMPLWYLLFVRSEEQHPLMAELISLPTVDDQIAKAIKSITSRLQSATLATVDRSRKDLGYSLISPDQLNHRKWICDLSCNYYNQLGRPSTREIRFENFEDYLLDLQERAPDHWSALEMVDPSQADESFSSKGEPLR